MKNLIFELYEFMNNYKPEDEEIYSNMIKLAQKKDKLYHCTNFEAFLSIIENKEFWMYPLAKMNDRDEYRRVQNTSYEKNVFISSFSYKLIDDQFHWNEYSKSNEDKALVFSVNRNWFSDEMYCIENNKCRKIIVNGVGERPTNLGEIRECVVNDFIAIYYDLNYNSEFEFQEGMYKFSKPRYCGFIKKSTGELRDSNSIKNWEDEYEIRKRVVLNSYAGLEFDADKIIIKLNNNSFMNFEIKFSPFVSEMDRELMKEKIVEKLPRSLINFNND